MSNSVLQPLIHPAVTCEGKTKRKKEKTTTFTSSWTHAKQTNYFCFRVQNTNACDRARMKDGEMCRAICGEWVTWLPPSVSPWIGCRGPEATRLIEQCKRCSCSVVVVVVVVALRVSVIPLRSSWAVKYRHAELSCVKIQTARAAAHPIGGAITRPAVQGWKHPGVGIKHLALLFLGAEGGAEPAKYNKIILCPTLFFAQASPSWPAERYS